MDKRFILFFSFLFCSVLFYIFDGSDEMFECIVCNVCVCIFEEGSRSILFYSILSKLSKLCYAMLSLSSDTIIYPLEISHIVSNLFAWYRIKASTQTCKVMISRNVGSLGKGAAYESVSSFPTPEETSSAGFFPWNRPENLSCGER